MTPEIGISIGVFLALALVLVALRTRILAAFGYELARTTPQRSAHDELRGPA